MDSLFSGLKLYEVLLMFLGTILFMSLLFILIWKVVKEKAIKSLLMFFLLPIVMIGYPSIKSISFGDFKAELQETTRQVAETPSDTVAHSKLLRLLAQVDYNRVKDDPATLTEIANAYSAIGNYDTALTIVDKAVEQGKGAGETQRVKEDIENKKKTKDEFDRKVAVLNGIVDSEKKPDAEQTKEVAEILATIRPPVYVSSESTVTIAKALAAVNEKEKALETLNKVPDEQTSDVGVRDLQTALQEDPTKNEVATPINTKLQEELKQSEIVNVPANKMVIMKHRAKQ
jgi:hypothetical protein